MGRAVGLDVVEEVWLEDDIILLKSLLLVFALHVAEVRVASDREGLIKAQATEGLIPCDLVGSGQLEGTVRDYLAIVLNSAHEIVHSIDLLEVNRDD